jgi:hypothetical protein
MRTYANKPRAKARQRYMTEAEHAAHVANVGGAKAAADLAREAAHREKKPSKYRNVKVEHHGITFDSKKELKCWLALKALEAAGEIADLRRQVRFELLPPEKLHGEKRTKPGWDYVADFVFTDSQGRMVVQDCKSKYTRTLSDFRSKKHAMKSLLKLDVEEI